MNTTQTCPAQALSPLARAILADWDDPDLSELDLATRHGLTLETLQTHTRTTAFRAALEILRELRAARRPFVLARAEAHAAQILTTLTARDPASATAAKEVRLAVKDLLRLVSLGAGGILPPDRPKGDARGADFQSAIPRNPQPQPATPETPPMQSADSPRGADFQSASSERPLTQPPDSPPPALRACPDPDLTPETSPRGARADGGQDAPRSESTPRPISSKPHKPKLPRGVKARPKSRSR